MRGKRRSAEEEAFSVLPVENGAVGKAWHKGRKGSLTHMEGGKTGALGPDSWSVYN